jgi:hypothetical protein
MIVNSCWFKVNPERTIACRILSTQIAEILEDDHLSADNLCPGDLAYMRRTSTMEPGWEGYARAQRLAPFF